MVKIRKQVKELGIGKYGVILPKKYNGEWVCIINIKYINENGEWLDKKEIKKEVKELGIGKYGIILPKNYDNEEIEIYISDKIKYSKEFCDNYFT